MPQADITTLKPKPVHQPAKPELRMILGGHGIRQIVPTRHGHLKIKTRQDQRALWQLRHRLHQRQCRAARSCRSGQYDWGCGRGCCPNFSQPFDHKPLSSLGVKCVIRRSKKRLNNL